MAIADLPSLAPLLPEVRARILAYAPKVLTQAQWLPLRAGAVDLAARCEPKTPVEARVLCSNLCAVLSAFIAEMSEPTVVGLFTALNVERHMAARRSEGVGEEGLAQRKSALGRLISAQAGLPAKAKRRGANTGPATEPVADYSAAEMAALAGCAAGAPAAIGVVVRSALILAAGYGIVAPNTATVVRVGDTLRSGDRTVVLAAADADALGDAIAFDRAQWHAALSYIARCPEVPGLSMLRLHATWLTSLFRANPSQRPLARILTVTPVGYAAIAHAYRLLHADGTDADLAGLRDA